jgi:hypothetical protein
MINAGTLEDPSPAASLEALAIERGCSYVEVRRRREL